MPSGKTTSNARRQSVIPPTDRTEHMPFLMSGRTPLTHSLTLLCRPAGTYFCRANPQVIVLVITVDNWVHDAGKELLACIAVFLQLKQPQNIRQPDNSQTNQLDDILYNRRQWYFSIPRFWIFVHSDIFHIEYRHVCAVRLQFCMTSASRQVV